MSATQPDSDYIDLPTVIGSLVHSRKFLVFALQALLSVGLYFATKYVDPSAVEDVKYVIAALVIPGSTLIFSIAKEDAANKALQTAFLANQTQHGKVVPLNEQLNA